jgi:hypothetical protein
VGAPKVGPWRGRLKRVFGIEIETCPACGGAVRIIACIEDPLVIETTAGMQEVVQRREQLPKILNHLDAKAAEPEAMRRPPCRAPPPAGLLFN